MDIRQPGRIPQLPAVGAATIFPIAALQPATARALDMAFDMKPPQRVSPLWAYSFIR